jgi:hypothetical protein
MPISSSIILIELSKLLFVPEMTACLNAENVRRCAVGPRIVSFWGMTLKKWGKTTARKCARGAKSGQLS